MATLAPLATRRSASDSSERSEPRRTPAADTRGDTRLPGYLTPAPRSAHTNPTSSADDARQEDASARPTPEARDSRAVDTKGSALGDRELVQIGGASQKGAQKGGKKADGPRKGETTAANPDADKDGNPPRGGKTAGKATQPGEDDGEARRGGDGSEDRAPTKKEPKEPPAPPAPPELGGIIPRYIPSPPPMARDRMLDILARTGKRPEAHHATIRQRLDAIASRARQQQDDIVREARLAAAGALASFMTRADEAPALVASAEERVRAAYGSARARVQDVSERSLETLKANEAAFKKTFDASTLSMEQQLQRVLASSSPQVRQLHAEQLKVVDEALGRFAARFDAEWGGKEKEMRQSPAQAVSGGAPSAQQLQVARLVPALPWAEILPARLEAEKEAWPKRANEKADTVRLSIDQNARQVLAQREQLGLSILQLVNPAAVQLVEKTIHDEGEVGKARKVTTLRIGNDYERAVKTVTEFRDRALKSLDQGEKGAIKEIRAVGARLEEDVRLRGQVLEASILDTARELADAYRVQMAGVNESIPGDGFIDVTQAEPVLAGAERRFEEMFAEQSASLALTVADTTDETDASVRAQMRSVDEMVGKQVAESGRIAGETTDAITGSTSAFVRSLKAPADGVTARATPYAATASEALGARPAQVRAAVAKTLARMKGNLDITIRDEKKRLQGLVDDMPLTLRDAVVSDGLKKISEIYDRARRAYKAMKGPGTDEAALSGSLRNLTIAQGEAMKAIWDDRIDPDETLVEWLQDDLSGDEERSALAYLSGDTAAGARYELEASMRWYGDDEDRIEAVLRDLQQEPPKGGHIGALKDQPGWAETHQELKSSLGGTDLDVVDALLEGNKHRADALRLRDKIEAARRKGDHDAVHKLLEGVPDSEIAGVRREFAGMQIGLGPKKVDPALISDKAASDVFVEFVSRTRVVYDPHRARMDGGPARRSMEMTGANLKLAVALAERSGKPDDLDSQVRVRAARMGVEATRKGDPNRENLQRAFEHDVAEIDPELSSPDPKVRQRAEQRRERLDPVRTEALRRFAEEQTGKPMTDAAARAYAAGVVESKFDSEQGRKFGRSMVEQGYADPAASMRLAVEGRGTDEDLIKRTLKRLDRDQIAEMKRVYKTRYDEDLDERLGTNQPKRDERTALAVMAISPLGGAVMLAAPGGELSGDERLEVDLLMRGRPRNDKERYELELARTEQQRTETGFAGKAAMEGSQDERLMDEGSRRMIDLVDRAGGVEKAFDEKGRFVGANPTRDKEGVLQPTPEEAWAFGEELKWSEFGVEAYQAGIDRLTNIIATALAVVAAVVVSILIPGLGGAIAGAIIGGLLSMAAKAALKGGRYGWEEAAVDLAVTAVDAATAGLTHGMGAALRGAGAAARGAATVARRSTGLLAGVATRGRKTGAYLITEGIENFVGSVPSAFTGQVLNDANWKGGSPFENILKGTFIEAGISTGVGLAAGTSIDLGGKAVGAVRGALRERALRTQLMASVPSDVRHAFAEVPIIELPGKQFDQLTGSRTGQAVTLVTPDGPVIYLREGASPRALREEGIHLLQSRDPDWARQVDALNEANLARWHELSLGEQLALYKTKIDVEIDAQQKLLLDLGDELALAGPLARRRLRQQVADAEVALANLQRRKAEVEQFPPDRIQRILDRQEGYPPYLDQPPRLFTKKQDPGERQALPATKSGKDWRDYSPQAKKAAVGESVVQIGPSWREGDRLYRRVGIVDTDGNIRYETQEKRSSHKDRRWVQRGSESQKRGQIAEGASRRMTAADVRPGWDTKPIPSQWDASGRGFDEVLLDFKIGEDGALVARIRIVEVKDYPRRWVPLDSFTAIRPPRAGVDGNLEKNLDDFGARLRSVGTLPPPRGYGLTAEQVSAALDARAAKHIDLEIRRTSTTIVGERGGNSALQRIKEEWKAFDIDVDIQVKEIPGAYVRAAQAESVGLDVSASLLDVPQAATARERRALRERALRNQLERGVPPHMRPDIADVPIIEVPSIEFQRVTGSVSGQAVTFITASGPVVVVRQGADPHVLREEGIHVAQSRERKWAKRVAALNETTLSDWDNLPVARQLELFKTKMDIEIDAQRRLLSDLGKELELTKGAAHQAVADRMREAQVTLENLTRLREQAGAVKRRDLERIAARRQARPDFLSQPPRLFSKRSRNGRDVPDDVRAGGQPRAPSEPPAVTPPLRAPDAPSPPAQGGVAGGVPTPQQRVLVVGAETEGEFAYAAEMAARGRDVTVINPERVTPAGEQYVAGGGQVVPSRIEQLPEEPTFNMIREDFPYPLASYLPIVETFVKARADRLLPGGRWVLITEGPFDEFPLTLQYAAEMAGLRVDVHRIPEHHEGTPRSEHPERSERFIFVITKPSPAGHVPGAPTGGPGPSSPGTGPGSDSVTQGHASPSPPPAAAAASARAETPGARLDDMLVQQQKIQAQIEESHRRERAASTTGRTDRAARIARGRQELLTQARQLADDIAAELERILPRIARGLDPPVPELIASIRDSAKGGRRLDAQQRIDSLRNRTRHGEPPHFGHLEGLIARDALLQNVIAVQQIRGRIAEVDPDAVLAVERGGSFLAEVLAHGQATFPPIHSLPKGTEGQRIPNLEARINELISLGQSSFVVVDFYMGGVFAEELRVMIERVLRSHPDVTIERIWMGESEGFERLVQPITAADLREGVATTPAFIRIVDGRVRFRRGVPAVALPQVRGTVENAPQIVQTRVPVSMVLGDDMRTVFDPDSRNPIRIFDRDGRIVQEIAVPVRDPVTGEELNTVRAVMIRLMSGVQFPKGG